MGLAYLPSYLQMQRNAQTVTALPPTNANRRAGGVCIKTSASSSIHKLRKTNTPAMIRASSAISSIRLLFMATACDDGMGCGKENSTGSRSGGCSCQDSAFVPAEPCLARDGIGLGVGGSDVRSLSDRGR